MFNSSKSGYNSIFHTLIVSAIPDLPRDPTQLHNETVKGPVTLLNRALSFWRCENENNQ